MARVILKVHLISTFFTARFVAQIGNRISRYDAEKLANKMSKTALESVRQNLWIWKKNIMQSHFSAFLTTFPTTSYNEKPNNQKFF